MTVRERRRASLVAQAEAALTRLSDHPRDPVARGSLAEAADGLESLLDEPGQDDRELRQRLVEGVRRQLAWPAPLLPIRTARLLLREREPGDLADLHAIFGREDVATHLLHPAMALDELEDHLARRQERRQRAPDVVGPVAVLDDRVVGEVALMQRGPTQAELAWTFHPDVSGRGLATEAARALLDVGFGPLALHRVYAELDARNTPSARLCERLGMRREGHRLADWWSKGEWTDTLQYAVLASEWPRPTHDAGGA